jgi:N-acetylglutamate synthase-like GNAT family acetyltransferase
MPPVEHARYALRPYGATDFDAVVEILQSNTPEFFAPSELDEFTAFLRAPQSELVVATSADREVVGFGAAYCRSAIEGGLAWGMVHRRWHRKGVGRALLDARIARRWAQAVTQIRVHTSQHSAGFFRQAGFAEIAVTPDGFGPGIDHVTMLLQRLASGHRDGGHAGTDG